MRTELCNGKQIDRRIIEAARRVATWNARDMLDYGYSHSIDMDEPYQDADTDELCAINDKNRARVIVHLAGMADTAANRMDAIHAWEAPELLDSGRERVPAWMRGGYIDTVRDRFLDRE